MVDFFGELRILVFVVTAVSMVVGIGYVMFLWNDKRRRRKDERKYAQMYGVCPDYRWVRESCTHHAPHSKHGEVPLPHYLYNAPVAPYAQQQQQPMYRGEVDTRSHTAVQYMSRSGLPGEQCA
jgi:hypothetical protein